MDTKVKHKYAKLTDRKQYEKQKSEHVKEIIVLEDSESNGSSDPTPKDGHFTNRNGSK